MPIRKSPHGGKVSSPPMPSTAPQARSATSISNRHSAVFPPTTPYTRRYKAARRQLWQRRGRTGPGCRGIRDSRRGGLTRRSTASSMRAQARTRSDRNAATPTAPPNPRRAISRSSPISASTVSSPTASAPTGCSSRLAETGLKPGAGPRHVAIHPGGKFVFVMNELDSTIVSLALDPQSGALDLCRCDAVGSIGCAREEQRRRYPDLAGWALCLRIQPRP